MDGELGEMEPFSRDPTSEMSCKKTAGGNSRQREQQFGEGGEQFLPSSKISISIMSIKGKGRGEAVQLENSIHKLQLAD